MTDDKRSPLPALQRLRDIMEQLEKIAAREPGCSLAPEHAGDIASAIKGEIGGRTTFLASFGVIGHWRSQLEKEPGRAIVEQWSTTMSPKKIFEKLRRHPDQFPLSKIPSEKTIRRWLKRDKS